MFQRKFGKAIALLCLYESVAIPFSIVKSRREIEVQSGTVEVDASQSHRRKANKNGVIVGVDGYITTSTDSPDLAKDFGQSLVDLMHSIMIHITGLLRFEFPSESPHALTGNLENATSPSNLLSPSISPAGGAAPTHLSASTTEPCSNDSANACMLAMETKVDHRLNNAAVILPLIAAGNTTQAPTAEESATEAEPAVSSASSLADFQDVSQNLTLEPNILFGPPISHFEYPPEKHDLSQVGGEGALDVPLAPHDIVVGTSDGQKQKLLQSAPDVPMQTPQRGVGEPDVPLTAPSTINVSEVNFLSGLTEYADVSIDATMPPATRVTSDTGEPLSFAEHANDLVNLITLSNPARFWDGFSGQYLCVCNSGWGCWKKDNYCKLHKTQPNSGKVCDSSTGAFIRNCQPSLDALEKAKLKCKAIYESPTATGFGDSSLAEIRTFTITSEEAKKKIMEVKSNPNLAFQACLDSTAEVRENGLIQKKQWMSKRKLADVALDDLIRFEGATRTILQDTPLCVEEEVEVARLPMSEKLAGCYKGCMCPTDKVQTEQIIGGKKFRGVFFGDAKDNDLGGISAEELVAISIVGGIGGTKEQKEAFKESKVQKNLPFGAKGRLTYKQCSDSFDRLQANGLKLAEKLMRGCWGPCNNIAERRKGELTLDVKDFCYGCYKQSQTSTAGQYYRAKQSYWQREMGKTPGQTLEKETNKYRCLDV